MNRKNAFSYIMWFLYSLAVCVYLLGLARLGSMQAGYSGFVGYIAGGLWFLVCEFIVLMTHRSVTKKRSLKVTSQMATLVVESLTVVSLFAVGIILRVSGLSGAVEDAAYYELAQVADGQIIPPVVHGAVYVYLQVLHLICLIFGNKFIAGVWLQIVLQLIAGFFIYRAVRKMSGVLASLVSLGFLMISPLMVQESLSLSPEMLFLAIFAIVLYLCVRCITGSKKLPVCLITGVLIAIVCYLDAMGVTLLLFAVAGLLLQKSEGDRSFGGRFLGALLCALGCGAGFFLLMALDSIASAKDMFDIIGAWWQVYEPLAFIIPKISDGLVLTADILFFVLIMPVGIFSFECTSKKESQSLWIWMAISLAILQCMGITTNELNGTLYLYIMFAILGGAGLSGMFVISEEDEELQITESPEADEERQPTEISEESGMEETILAETMMEDAVTAEQEVIVIEEPPKVKLIDNPLPLPKKHVKKVLDYDVMILDEDMDDFDMDINADDDFDI